MSGRRIRVIFTGGASHYSESFKRKVVAEYERGNAGKRNYCEKIISQIIQDY